MPVENITRHPSYKNRYRSSTTEFGSPVHTENQHDNIFRVSDSFPGSPELDPNSPNPLDAANNRRLRFKDMRSLSNSGKPLNASMDYNQDDVFVDMQDPDIITDYNDIIKIVDKRPVEAVMSNSSTASILPNPYNRVNHRIHSFFWCSCCLYFVFICCLPGVHYMQESDKEFQQGEEKKAQRLGKMSTLMYLAGTIFSVAVYAAILFIVIFFVNYR